MTDHSSIFHSRLFTFNVGDNESPITVHFGAVASMSGPLKALMDEKTHTGEPRVSANLNGVREEDFVRFCDFIYKNDYVNPYPVVAKPLSGTKETSPETPTRDANKRKPEELTSGGATDTNTAKRPRLETPVPNMSPSSFGRPTPLSALSSSDVAVQNKCKLSATFEKHTGRPFGSVGHVTTINTAHEDFTNVFIAHAAMYAFAERFEIAGLKTLSLDKLRDRLVRWQLFPHRVGDVAALVRHVYSIPGEHNELKDLISRYVASEIGILGSSQEFRDLLQEGGPFVDSFWTLIYDNLLRNSSVVFGGDGSGKE